MKQTGEKKWNEQVNKIKLDLKLIGFKSSRTFQASKNEICKLRWLKL